MSISGHYIPEGCMALFLMNESNAIDGRFPVKRLFKMTRTFVHVLKNEQLLKDFPEYLTLDKLIHRLQYFENQKMLTISEDKLYVTKTNSEAGTSFLNFGMQLVIPLIDTYIVALLVVDHICGKNLVLNQKTLIREMHEAFKILYINDRIIPYLSSCIEEIIQTAIERFTECGILQSQPYANNTGTFTTYI